MTVALSHTRGLLFEDFAVLGLVNYPIITIISCMIRYRDQFMARHTTKAMGRTVDRNRRL